MAAASLIPADLLAMMARGVSVNVSSRSLQLRPSVMRAVGSSVSADGRNITVFVVRSQARQLVQDVAACGQIAVVFSEPLTHHTVQVKASRVTLRNAEAADEAVLTTYLRSMEYELSLIRIPVKLTRAMLAYRLEDVVAISFEPEQVFEQTPGPRAGTRISGGGS